MKERYGDVNSLLEKLDFQFHEIDVYCIEIQDYLKGTRSTPLSKIKNEHLNKTLWMMNLKADFLKSRLRKIHSILGIKNKVVYLKDFLETEDSYRKKVLH